MKIRAALFMHILSALLCCSCSGTADNGSIGTTHELPKQVIAPFHQAAPVVGDRPRGFNLSGMFSLEYSPGYFSEPQMQMIHDFGFNYVRIPLDYRFYTRHDDWFIFSEAGLAEIDRIVEWGQKYGIHIELNLHRAPGYCVNAGDYPAWLRIPDNQKQDLWTDSEAREAFIFHWEMFAQRYMNISGEYLGFNLLNEPANVDNSKYAEIIAETIGHVRALSPERPISVDGYNWATELDDTLIALGVTLSRHSYDPMNITHYKAEWISGQEQAPEPAWPPSCFLPDHLYGSYKAAEKLQRPLVIDGTFPAGTVIHMKIIQVSNNSRFVIAGSNGTVFEHNFVQSSGSGEWEKVIYQERWHIYQNIYNREYSVELPLPSEYLEFRIEKGDWLRWAEIKLNAAGKEILIRPTITDWGVPPGRYRISENTGIELTKAPEGFENHFRISDGLDAWRAAAAQNHAGIMIGEFGVYNKTPHDVTLALLEYKLRAFTSAGFGWALWEFAGPFGPMDSARPDVIYEEYQGHLLDRKMMELLQKY
ncbi:MAG: cellulase family glycosylhydrolase [Spirochaetales bacterium]|nr:cellulase family glycosylhydrolase [Spirochaetales bacterium]